MAASLDIDRSCDQN